MLGIKSGSAAYKTSTIHPVLCSVLLLAFLTLLTILDLVVQLFMPRLYLFYSSCYAEVRETQLCDALGPSKLDTIAMNRNVYMERKRYITDMLTPYELDQMGPQRMHGTRKE